MHMNNFDPKLDIENAEVILDDDEWPSFHDSEILAIDFWRGDVRPDDDSWVGPVIKVRVELCAMDSPYVVNLEFSDCSDISMTNLDHQNYVYDLEFKLEDRGTYLSGKPLPPYICVNFKNDVGSRMKFKCFSIKAVSRDNA